VGLLFISAEPSIGGFVKQHFDHLDCLWADLNFHFLSIAAQAEHRHNQLHQDAPVVAIQCTQ
jgi:hypothetical protein